MPSNTSANMFHYTYVLESIADGKRYLGYTSNLKKRLVEHNDAQRREHYLKTTQGSRFLSLRLIEYRRAKRALGIGR